MRFIQTADNEQGYLYQDSFTEYDEIHRTTEPSPQNNDIH